MKKKYVSCIGGKQDPSGPITLVGCQYIKCYFCVLEKSKFTIFVCNKKL